MARGRPDMSDRRHVVGMPGIVGLILGIISIAKDKPGKGMAVAGIVTSAIGIVLFFLVFAVILAIPS